MSGEESAAIFIGTRVFLGFEDRSDLHLVSESSGKCDDILLVRSPRSVQHLVVNERSVLFR